VTNPFGGVPLREEELHADERSETSSNLEPKSLVATCHKSQEEIKKGTRGASAPGLERRKKRRGKKFKVFSESGGKNQSFREAE